MNAANPIANIIDKLYESVDGMRISLSERDRLQITDSNYTYGEVNPVTFVDMLELVKPQPGDVFYDLGCGVGKAVFCAALMADWKKCCGVELLHGLAQKAQELVPALENMKEVKELCPNRKFHIQFVEDDFLKADISDATVIFLHATTFGQPVWDQLKARLNSLPPGLRVIVNTKQLDSDYFEKIDETTRLMGWGESMAFTYQKFR